MPSTDQRPDVEDERSAPEPAFGADPGAADTWDIVRVHCPECDRPIALIGDEESLPQHAVLPSAWHPFSPAICRGTGAPTADLPECEEHEAQDGFESLVALPTALDWRTQPFSHAGAHRAVRAFLPVQRDRRAA
ncbi:hypothetical protein AB0K51_31645 [Kitasatospora sp. NPDC049285]|uniref:hypothetical protein n=1 Tax=Kitasatospora sp. NPDC049285 TaxID=3157096 RepID=UPI0034269585